MKLYSHPYAPNPKRLAIFLNEKGIKVNTVFVDFMKGATKHPDFTKLNPFQRLPVLELDDGTILSETVAICRYFEEMNPLKSMFGLMAIERAEVEMWQRRAELYCFLPVVNIFRHLHPAMKELEQPQVRAWGEANRPKVFEAMRIMNSRLQSVPYLAGERFSIADITLYCALDFCKPIRVAIPNHLTHLIKYYETLQERPAIMKLKEAQQAKQAQQAKA
ncbi:glutathione S-transferase family protein [Polycladidibacter stylochi]|uniref:glutathione S-transferase family protein n=1 Tax=Polycladidibacter stylochi TaxID=1807766 RepID=UPI0008334ADC|nr:glutathione S-transferase [Pseudovibrio stylochi]